MSVVSESITAILLTLFGAARQKDSRLSFLRTVCWSQWLVRAERHYVNERDATALKRESFHLDPIWRREEATTSCILNPDNR